MPLLFAHIVPGAVILAADQRLTLQGGGRIWDEQSSKLVAILCTDGAAVIGYTGLAYLRNLPTDEYIARLAIDLLAPGAHIPRSGTMIGGDRTPIRIATTLKTVIDKLHSQVAKRNDEFTLIVAGQRRLKRRLWPFVSLIDHLERHTSYPVMRGRSLTLQRWAMAGDTGVPDDLFAHYERSVAYGSSVLPDRHPIEISIRAMRDTFNHRHQTTPTVGDSMHIAVIGANEIRLGMWAGPLWRNPGIAIPALPGAALPADLAAINANIYSPWVVSSQVVMPPAVMSAREIKTGAWYWDIVISEIMKSPPPPPVYGLSGFVLPPPTFSGWGPAKRRRAP